jgi:hypothetical protein
MRTVTVCSKCVAWCQTSSKRLRPFSAQAARRLRNILPPSFRLRIGRFDGQWPKLYRVHTRTTKGLVDICAHTRAMPTSGTFRLTCRLPPRSSALFRYWQRSDASRDGIVFEGVDLILWRRSSPYLFIVPPFLLFDKKHRVIVFNRLFDKNVVRKSD